MGDFDWQSAMIGALLMFSVGAFIAAKVFREAAQLIMRASMMQQEVEALIDAGDTKSKERDDG